jgi:hypothetical protein
MNTEDNIIQAMKDIEDSLLNDSTFSTASNQSPEGFNYEKLLDAMNKLPKIEPEDNLLGIIITKHAHKNELGKCQIEKGFYILIQKKMWKKEVKDIFISNKSENFLSMVSGTPVYEDDNFALKIMQESKDYYEKLATQYMVNLRLFQNGIGFQSKIYPIITTS